MKTIIKLLAALAITAFLVPALHAQTAKDGKSVPIANLVPIRYGMDQGDKFADLDANPELADAPWYYKALPDSMVGLVYVEPESEIPAYWKWDIAGKNLTTVGATYPYGDGWWPNYYGSGIDRLELGQWHSGNQPASLTIDTTGRNDLPGVITASNAQPDDFWVVGNGTADVRLEGYWEVSNFYQMSTTADLIIKTDIFSPSGSAHPNYKKYGAGKMIIDESMTALVYGGHGQTVHVEEGILQMDGQLRARPGSEPGNWRVADSGTLTGKGLIEAATFKVEAGGVFSPNGMEVQMYDLNWGAGGARYGTTLNMQTGSIFQIDVGEFSISNPALKITEGTMNLAEGVTLVLTGINDPTGITSLGIDADFNGTYFTKIKAGLTELTLNLDESSGDVYVYTDKFNNRIEIDYVTKGMSVQGDLVPEPTTWALMVGGLGVLALLRRGRS